MLQFVLDRFLLVMSHNVLQQTLKQKHVQQKGLLEDKIFIIVITEARIPLLSAAWKILSCGALKLKFVTAPTAHWIEMQLQIET